MLGLMQPTRSGILGCCLGGLWLTWGVGGSGQVWSRGAQKAAFSCLKQGVPLNQSWTGHLMKLSI